MFVGFIDSVILFWCLIILGWGEMTLNQRHEKAFEMIVLEEAIYLIQKRQIKMLITLVFVVNFIMNYFFMIGK